MKTYIGYIRVSTAKQGTQGVSLAEQREAISRYAAQHSLPIADWLEERESAAKRGRPIFNLLLKRLRSGSAHGVILHKLDRGARNLKDWAEIAEMSDQGVEVHFANDNLDLHSRGGRLSADIQAVVAADFIRNLREETRKGFYGRLKQGHYPLRAPIGYTDQGKARVKAIDDLRAPLIREAFVLYGRGNLSLDTLGEEMFQRGLRNRNGGRITRNGWSTLLRNPFYIGLMRIRKTNECFNGMHEPLIPKALFTQVQDVLSGKVFRRSRHSGMVFKRLLKCGRCSYSLIGEIQKGHVYYRCHSKECAGTSVRETQVESAFSELLSKFQFSEFEMATLQNELKDLSESWENEKAKALSAAELALGQIEARLTRLTDVFLEGAVDRDIYEKRKEALLLEKRALSDRLIALNNGAASVAQQAAEILELGQSALQSYETANCEEKRELIRILTSNRIITGKNVDLEPSGAFKVISERPKGDCSDQQRDIRRTFKEILKSL